MALVGACQSPEEYWRDPMSGCPLGGHLDPTATRDERVQF